MSMSMLMVESGYVILFETQSRCWACLGFFRVNLPLIIDSLQFAVLVYLPPSNLGLVLLEPIRGNREITMSSKFFRGLLLVG